MTKHTCQHCKRQAKFRSPNGLLVCGVHRKRTDAYYERLRRNERCKPLS